MRRDNIYLDEDMLQSLIELPEEYNYGMYSRFIDDYGTHFMTSGTIGGIFEYILVVNKDKMTSSGLHIYFIYCSLRKLYISRHTYRLKAIGSGLVSYISV